MIEELLNEVLQKFSLVAYALVFLGGVITSIGPCNMAMVPVAMAYVSGSQTTPTRWRGLVLSSFFTLGSSITFVILGVVIAAIGGLFGTAQAILYYIVGGVCIVIGFSMLGFFTLPTPLAGKFARAPEKKGPLGAMLLGLVMGLAGSQCGTPVLLAVLTLVMAKGQMLYGATLLFFYALGRGIPVIAAGTFTGALKNMSAAAKWSAALEKLAGGVMLIIGAYFIWTA